MAAAHISPKNTVAGQMETDRRLQQLTASRNGGMKAVGAALNCRRQCHFKVIFL